MKSPKMDGVDTWTFALWRRCGVALVTYVVRRARSVVNVDIAGHGANIPLPGVEVDKKLRSRCRGMAGRKGEGKGGGFREQIYLWGMMSDNILALLKFHYSLRQEEKIGRLGRRYIVRVALMSRRSV